MRYPEFQGFRVKTQAFAAAETVGHHQGHMANQAALVAFKQERQPGVARIGPQGPEPRLGAFRQFAWVILRPGPIETKLEHWPLAQQCIQRLSAPDLQRP